MMRSSAPALFPKFRSTAHAEIVAATLLHPARERTRQPVALPANQAVVTLRCRGG